MIEIFKQKYVKDILILLFESHEGMFFTDIQNKITENYEVVHQSAVSRAISTLFQNKLIIKEEIRDDQKNIPKSYYKITDMGDFAFEILEMDKKLDKMVHTKFKMEINGGKNTNIQTEHLDLKIEYK